MTERDDDRYRGEPFRGARRWDPEERGFPQRIGDEDRSWFGEVAVKNGEVTLSGRPKS